MLVFPITAKESFSPNASGEKVKVGQWGEISHYFPNLGHLAATSMSAIAFLETPQLGDVEKFPDSALAVYTSHEYGWLVVLTTIKCL